MMFVGERTQKGTPRYCGKNSARPTWKFAMLRAYCNYCRYCMIQYSTVSILYLIKLRIFLPLPLPLLLLLLLTTAKSAGDGE